MFVRSAFTSRSTRRKERWPGERTLAGHVVDEGEERGPEAADVEERDRLGVDAELRPGDDLEELVGRPMAAGERDESVGQVGHERLALVHGADDVELREALVRDLAVDEGLRDDPNDLAASRQHGVRQDPHQADGSAAVHEPDPAPRQLLPER